MRNLILKLTNKSKNFYSNLGKVFGSREIQRKTHDRMYDDDNKIWYVYYNKGAPIAFVSVVDNIIKNVWGEDEKHIIAILKKINSEITIKTSTLTIIFKDLYKKAGFEIIGTKGKNFINIRSAKIERD